MNESKDKDIWTVLIVIFSTDKCSQLSQKKAKQLEKKADNHFISWNIDNQIELQLFLRPLQKETFLSFSKHSLPKCLKTHQQIHYCDISKNSYTTV